MKQARLTASVAAIMAGSAFASSALANEVNIYSAAITTLTKFSTKRSLKRQALK